MVFRLYRFVLSMGKEKLPTIIIMFLGMEIGNTYT